MDEDEEVVLKNNGLYACLVDAGFHDFESTEKTEFSHNSKVVEDNIESSSTFLMNENYSSWQEYESYIQTCLQSKLVFADDVSLVEHYVTSSNLSHSESAIFSIVKVISYSAVGLSFNACRFLRTRTHPIIFWSLQALPLVICGICLSHHSYEKLQRRKIVSHLLSTLKELSLLVQKSVQFLLNRSVLTFIYDQSKVNHKENTYLQKVLFSTLRSTIFELKNDIISLIRDYPIKEVVESQQYYLAYLCEEDLHCVHPSEVASVEYLQKMKYTYFLLQSEFLRRLCLCFIPSLQMNYSKASTSQLFKRLSATTAICSQLCQHLKSTFEMHYLFEKRSYETHLRETNLNWTYREVYIKLCSISLNLQSVLRESRHLEEMLEDAKLEDTDHNRVVTSLNIGAQRIDSAYNKCHSAIDDFRKYVISLLPKHDQNSPRAVIESASSGPEVNKINVLVGKSDFRPQWPDEVFVGVSSEGDVQPKDLIDVQSPDVANPCAKLLISELKLALRDKAEEWKSRERKALQKKDIQVDSESEEELPMVKEPTTSESRPKRREQQPPIIVAPVSRESCQLSESALAKQIAAASVSWKLHEEQHFSFDNDDSGDDIESCG